MARISRTDLPVVVLLTTTGSSDASTATDWQSSASGQTPPPGHVLARFGRLRS